MSTTRRVSIKIALDGYEEYQATISKLNQQNKLLESELSVIDSRYRDNTGSLEHLTDRQKTLQSIHDNEVNKLKAIGDALNFAKQKQQEYSDAMAEAQKKVDDDTRAIEEYTREIQVAKEWLAIITEQQGANSEAAQRQRDYINDLTSHLNAYKVQLNEDNDALEKATAYYNTATGEVGKMTIAYNNQQIAVDKSTDALKNNASAIATSEPVWEILKTKLNDIAKDAENLKKAVEPIKKILDESAQAAMDFESAFAGVEKTFHGSDEELNQYREDIKKMSTEIPMTTKELSKIGETAGQLGIEGDSIKDFTEVVAALGVTTNISSSEAATLLAQFENVANFTSGEGNVAFQKFASALVHLGNNSATTEADIMKMAQRFSSAGTLAGLSAPEILGMATALSSVGIQAESGGTSLTKLTQYIQATVEDYNLSMDEYAKKTGLTGNDLRKAYDKMRKDAEEWANAMGYTADEFADLWKDAPAEAISEFINHLNEVYESGGSVRQTLEELGFGEVRLRNATMALAASEKGIAYYVDMANDAWDENNALQEEAQKRYDTTESKQTMLKNSLELVKIEIGNALLPVISQLATSFRDILVPLADWIAKNPELIETIGKAILIITTLTTAVSGVNTVIQTVSSLMNPTTAIIMGIATAVGIATTMFQKYQETLPPAARTVDDFRIVTENTTEAVSNLNTELDESVSHTEGYANEALKLVDHLDELEQAGLDTAEAQEEYRLTVEKLNGLIPSLSLTIDEETGKLTTNTDEIRNNITAWRDKMKLEAYQKKYSELLDKQIELEDEAIQLDNERTSVEQDNQRKRAKVIALETELRELHNKAYQATGGELIEIQNRINEISDTELPKAEKALEESKKELDNVTQAIQDNEAEQRFLQREMTRTETAMGFVSDQAKETAKDMTDEGKASGENYAKGIIKGIDKKEPEVISRMKKLAKSASAKFNQTLEIQSPSKVAMRSAQYMMDGYIMGVDNREKEWVGAIENIATEGIDTYNDAMKQMDADVSKSGLLDFKGSRGTKSTLEIQQDSDTKNMLNNIAKAVVEYLPQLSNMQVVMDSNRLVGQLAPKMDSYFTEQQFANERGI